MAYVTQQALIDRFGEAELIQLTDRGATGLIDSAVLGQAIADADAEIDSYLCARYVVPVTSPSGALVLHAANIVRYRLYDDQSIEEVTERYKQALAWLRDVRDGRMPLDGADPATSPTQGSAGASRTLIMGNDCMDKIPGASCA